MGQVEMNLGAKDLNSTLDSSDNSTNYSGEERYIVYWTENTNCTPGKLPDPGSCTRYFLCVEVLPGVFREYTLYCPPNLVYNSHTSECVSPYFYQCAVRFLHGHHPIPPLIVLPRPPPFYPPIWPPYIWPPYIWPPPRPPPSPWTTGPIPIPWTPTKTIPNPRLPSPCKFPLCNRKNLSFCRGIRPRVYYCKWKCEHPSLKYVPFC